MPKCLSNSNVTLVWAPCHGHGLGTREEQLKLKTAGKFRKVMDALTSAPLHTAPCQSLWTFIWG